ncbi:hypothetical protein E2K98_03800 [Bacillus salipaludis]|uniref:RCK C-terminal domain-containing protein n=1 Tax=Bacillus salipaludis TaxID=2547811 RepID=A0A4R5VXG5_9BACI|nr:hypothetical protein [Bacillus salipaludis]MDQ6595142.1 hypothetical protein [Bacillus salipaludis]TDK64001.1 hypothetical protein E2K98_03800 [Bacillus salipaludis]
MTLLFLLIYFIIIVAVIEIFVILFRLTGLKVEISRFQVISLMTGTGFTTDESELILGHPIRRKLATFLILFGAFSLAVIISSISQFLSKGLQAKEIFFLAAMTMLVYLVLKLTWLQRKLSSLFNRKMQQKVELADLPVREIFLKSKEDVLLYLHIFRESKLAGHTFNQMIEDLDQLELNILFIQRGKVKIRRNLLDTPLHEGDQVLLFGTKKAIYEAVHEDLTIMKEKEAEEELL